MPKTHLQIESHQIPTEHIIKSFSHSSGAGGQNVNKTNTKVHLRLNLEDLHELPQDLKDKLKTKLGADHILAESQETRHQHQNLEIAIDHLQKQIDEALQEDTERKHTKPKHLTKLGKWLKQRKDKWLKYQYRSTHPKDFE
jgi:ribosome-associated protein